MHGSYKRYAVYFEDDTTIICEQIEIKRILCVSCGTTHAVLPGDIIPYLLLSLFVFVYILFLFYLEKNPVLKIVEKCDFSFQLIYCILHIFKM